MSSPTGLLPNALLTVDDAQEFLNIDEGDEDTLEILINSVSTLIEGEANCKFVQQEIADYRLDGNDTAILRLPFRPVVSITSIEVRDNVTDAAVSTYTEGDFTLKDARAGTVMLTSGATFPRGTGNIVATWTAGYPEGNSRLQLARKLALVQIGFEYKQFRANDFGVTSRSYQDGSIAIVPSGVLLPQVRQALIGPSLKHFAIG